MEASAGRVTRRTKLTKQERRKRESKRLKRAERSNKSELKWREALKAYIRAITHADYEEDRCVCEKCGLEQPYQTGEWDLKTGLVTISICEGWEYIGCGSELCYVSEYAGGRAEGDLETGSE